MDLLLADHSSASTCAQTSQAPICFVTLGIIQGALAWATRQEADVEEIACKAAGAPTCQFRLKQGGN
jgi:predicted hydrocarbon binding protein